MVCPNCGSNEVITVQGENFCINCGQLVPKASAPAAPISTDGLPDGVTILPVGSAMAPVKKKRGKLGRPKAGRLDVVTADPAPITAMETISNHRRSLPLDLSLVTPVAIPKAEQAIEHEVPADTSAPIVRVHPNPSYHRAQTETLPPVLDRVVMAYGSVLRLSLSERYHGRRSWLASLPAAVATVIALGIVMTTWRNPTIAFQHTVHNIGTLSAEAVVLGMLYYLIRSLTHAAIIFGSARQADHRPLAPDRWLSVASSSQARRTGIDAFSGIIIVALVCLILGLIAKGSTTWPVPYGVQISLLFGAFIVLLYAMLAVVMTASLAHVAVTLAPLHTLSSYKLGWRLFRHHFELAGARFLALLIELIVLAAVGVGAIGWLSVTPTAYIPFVIASLGIVTVVLGSLAGSGSAIWWTHTYRMLIRADHPAGFHRLLSSQAPKHARRGPIVIVTLAILALSISAAIIPWML
jgi:hypothetical protein